MHADNLLSNVWNHSRGAVLPKPFPGAVTQGVILIFVIVNKRLYKAKVDLSTQTTQLDP